MFQKNEVHTLAVGYRSISEMLEGEGYNLAVWELDGRHPETLRESAQKLESQLMTYLHKGEIEDIIILPKLLAFHGIPHNFPEDDRTHIAFFKLKGK